MAVDRATFIDSAMTILRSVDQLQGQRHADPNHFTPRRTQHSTLGIYS